MDMEKGTPTGDTAGVNSKNPNAKGQSSTIPPARQELNVSLEVSPEGIPGDLRASPRWVCWKLESREGKITKPPVNPRTGDNAKTNDRATWAPFDFALAAARQHGWGIGFVFDGSDMVGIDLDHVRDSGTGALTAEAQAILDDVDGYAEISPSGTGIHVITRGTFPKGAGNRVPLTGHTGLEMYGDGRYFTVTGNALPGRSDIPATAQPAIDRLVAKYLTRPKANGKARPSDVADVDRARVVLNDAEIIGLARDAANGGKFSRLFDAGDLTGHDGDDSRADLALVCILVFWTRDPAQLDRLFRQSKLYREKWDRADYRERTITAALAGVTETYTGKRAKRRTAERAETARLANLPQDAAPFADTDTRNAERFAAQHGREVRWCEKWAKWLTWDGTRWTEDAATIIRRRAGLTARSVYPEIADIENDKERADLRAWAKHSESAAARRNMLDLARSEEGIEIKTDDLDRDPFALNVENGTIDLRTGELRPHRREDFLTKLSPVTFDPTATCPTFEQFLSEVMDGRAELVDYLHRALGYAMTGAIREHVLFLFHGSGRNGKSTLTNIVRDVIGADYSTEGVPELLTISKYNVHTEEKAKLFGKRFVTTVEVDEGKRLAEALVKTLTGGDPVTAMRKYEHSFEFMPTHKIFFRVNYRPEIRGTDPAIWSRIKLIPWDVSFEGREDGDLPGKLKAERPGILAWLVRGAVEWHTRGLKPEPEKVSAAVADYRAEMDSLGDFLADCCDIGRKYSEHAGGLFERYKAWTKDTGGGDPVNSNVFGRRLTARGFASDRTTRERRRLGLRLKVEDFEPGSNG